MADRNNPQQNNWGRSNQLSPIYYQGPTPWSPPPIFDANLHQPYRYVWFSHSLSAFFCSDHVFPIGIDTHDPDHSIANCATLPGKQMATATTTRVARTALLAVPLQCRRCHRCTRTVPIFVEHAARTSNTHGHNGQPRRFHINSSFNGPCIRH